MIGGGMYSYDKECFFPAYCSGGHHLVTVNLARKRLRCPTGHKTEPVPYNHESLVAQLGKEIVADWLLGDRVVALTNGTYLCPRCQNPTLTFSEGEVMWD